VNPGGVDILSSGAHPDNWDDAEVAEGHDCRWDDQDIGRHEGEVDLPLPLGRVAGAPTGGYVPAGSGGRSPNWLSNLDEDEELRSGKDQRQEPRQ